MVQLYTRHIYFSIRLTSSTYRISVVVSKYLIMLPSTRVRMWHGGSSSMTPSNSEESLQLDLETKQLFIAILVGLGTY
jgi:hypothetical protein